MAATLHRMRARSQGPAPPPARTREARRVPRAPCVGSECTPPDSRRARLETGRAHVRAAHANRARSDAAAHRITVRSDVVSLFRTGDRTRAPDDSGVLTGGHVITATAEQTVGRVLTGTTPGAHSDTAEVCHPQQASYSPALFVLPTGRRDDAAPP